MSTKKKIIKALRVIIVVCYILAFISVSRYQVEFISFTRCVHDMIINAMVVVSCWATIEIIQAKRIK